jgi:N-acetylgalactosamine-N,N'-diacetylbacillosaminyl-diphospho-undecaprenol 4-alpha-N-acetylgalactosaminyltransferase
MKKIFFLINDLGLGGAENVITTLMPRFSKKYDLSIITLKNNNKQGILESPLSNCHSNLAMLLNFPIYYFKLKRILKENPGCKIISFLELSNFLNILTNKNAIISFRTNMTFFKGIKGWIYTMLIKKLYPKSKLIITNSVENTQYLKEFLNKNEIVTIYNPLDLNKIKILSNEFVESEVIKKIKNKRVFISIGRLDKQKRTELIISCFENERDVLLILGDGPERKKLEFLAKDKNVLFLGNQKNIFKYLKLANYFIFASAAEGFPNVLIEANAMNVPIITSDFKTGAREMMNSNLTFNEKIKYPYKCETGYLLSLDNFKKDFKKLKLNSKEKVKNKSALFEKTAIVKKWEEFLN